MEEKQQTMEEMIAEQVKEKNRAEREEVEKQVRQFVDAIFKAEAQKKALDQSIASYKDGLKKLKLPEPFAFSL